ncbi:MAG: ribonuclease D [Gammaproteobacteria bacterium]|jgi:ribonuclease D|nr:ribonuclease D [Gammaproteobacteria bacterium]MBU2279355.1 ribonuclease D [Gammaproteobacteria bacterium]MBU2428121.1 ribonuclease D [Gammaproteobacteria bacterium]
MSYRMITDNAQLAEFCQLSLTASCLAVDTEFVRISTLAPKLGLIQLYAGADLVLVDPLSITDWQPLAELLAAPSVLKLLHSCNEDLEAFASVGLIEIRPLLDTQLAAELAGMGSSLGYAKMVEQLLNKQVDKTESRTDWLARPLAETQLAYAAHDVLYLYQLKDLLLAKLSDSKFLPLLLAEGEQMINRRHHQLPVSFKYLEMKSSWQCQPRELAVLRALTTWRAGYAEQKDMALGLVLKDAVMYELAKRRPVTLEGLAQIQDLHPRELRRHGSVLLELIGEAKALPADLCPQTFYHQAEFAGFKVAQQQLTDAVQQAATASGIPAGFLSVKRQLNEYLNWCWRVSDAERSQLPIPEYLRGWRRDILLPYLPKPAQVAALI